MTTKIFFKIYKSLKNVNQLSYQRENIHIHCQLIVVKVDKSTKQQFNGTGADYVITNNTYYCITSPDFNTEALMFHVYTFNMSL